MFAIEGAEVSVNGSPAGTRIWAPYRFGLGERVRPGRNEIEILVLNTLGPYMNAVSPTPFVSPGQEASGLFGPVELLVGPPPPVELDRRLS